MYVHNQGTTITNITRCTSTHTQLLDFLNWEDYQLHRKGPA